MLRHAMITLRGYYVTLPIQIDVAACVTLRVTDMRRYVDAVAARADAIMLCAP